MPSEREVPEGVRQLVQVVHDTRLPSPSERQRIRCRAGISFRRAGAAMGVSAASVQAWERGQQPRPEHALTYRAFLDALEAATADAA